MSGSTNPFGQSSTSPFGSQSVFGQTNTSNSNPFAPVPFGSTAPFGSPTGSSLSGGTSTGVFGVSQSSPFSLTNTFGASSSPVFGNAVPAFRSSSTSAFGNSSSLFVGLSVSDQNPVFGAFGSTPTQTGPLGSGGHPSQLAFGSRIFGSSTPFGASTQLTFGSTSTPSSIPAFGSTSSPTYVFLEITSTPTCSATSTHLAFGSTSSPFGSMGSTSAFGTSSTPTFRVSIVPAFGSITASFSFGSTPTYGQSTSAFGSGPFGSTSLFEGRGSSFGPQTTASTYVSTGIGQSGFGGQRGGSRVANYTPTTEEYCYTWGQTAKLESISAMPIYNNKSHEELRWEDYQIGDKGSSIFGGFGSTTQTSPFGSVGQISKPAFGSNIFGSSAHFGASTQPAFGSTSTPTSSATGVPAFSSTSTSTFGAIRTLLASGSTSSPTFGSTGSAFGASSPVFGAGGAFGGSSNSLFGSSSTSEFETSSTQEFGVSSEPALGSSSTCSFSFGLTPTFGQSTSSGSSPSGSASLFEVHSSPFGPRTTASTSGRTGIGQSGVEAQRSGSRVANYTPTIEADGGGSEQTAKFESISAMPVYKDKSHEELRWEDYQIGHKGGPICSAQSTGLVCFNSTTSQTNFAPSSAFGQSSANPFSASTLSKPFGPKSSAFSTSSGTSTSPSFSSSVLGTLKSGGAFGALSASLTGSSNASASGASSTPSLTFGLTQSFGQSTSASGSSPSGSTSSPFEGHSSPFGPQTAGSTFGRTGFGQSGFEAQRSGSRVANYTPTIEADIGESGQTAKFESISAMLVYNDKSHEELRWDDYQIGDKGGPISSAQSSGLVSFN